MDKNKCPKSTFRKILLENNSHNFHFWKEKKHKNKIIHLNPYYGVKE